MNKKFTSEDIIKVAKCCIVDNCVSCPLAGHGNCITDFMNHILEYMKNEPAPAATGTSSEVSVKEDTDNIHLNDSVLLDICQEGLCTVAQSDNADYQIGYADAVLDVIKKLKGGDNNG